MLGCWEAEAERRPSFNEIELELMEEVGKGYVIDNLDDDSVNFGESCV